MVSVWDHIPTSNEIIELRTSEGWTPTCSLLRDGPKILGDAELWSGIGGQGSE
ncbi:MAG TPA: hypothetical protein VFC63_03040 [Blastocatellia bacterium]|nr:hypothetical protein [Blastocatellia bacterium]